MFRSLSLRLACFVLVSCCLTACGEQQSGPTPVESPTSQNLRSIWADPDGGAWAVGLGGTIVRYDGSSWSLADSPTSVTLRHVQGTAANDVWAAGDNGVLVHWDGAEWSTADSPTTDSFNRVYPISSSDVLVLSISAYRGQPGAWEDLDLPGVYDPGWVTSPSDIWLFDSLGDFIHHDGSTWTEVSTPVSGVPLWYDSWSDGDDIWLIGSSYGNDADLVLRSDAGGSWTTDEQPWPEGGPSYGIGGEKGGPVWRVGWAFAAVFEDGQWTPVPLGDDTTLILNDVAATPTGVFAVGDDGAILHMDP